MNNSDDFAQVDIRLESWLSNLKDEMVESARSLLRIPSVMGPSVDGAPFGPETRQALDFVLELANRYGFRTKMLDGYAAWAEFGDGDKIVGVLSHVDVVPVGDAWTYDPFAATVVGDKIFARGAIDDKGPSISGLYALFALKECGIPINCRMRAIVGADEESGFRCMTHYFASEEMPTVGFTPDGSFPVIYAEKGIAGTVIRIPVRSDTNIKISGALGGARTNMVPSSASLELQKHSGDWQSVSAAMQTFEGITVEASADGQTLKVRAEGKGAHASLPHEGVNAVMVLCNAILDADAAGDLSEEIKTLRGYAADNTGAVLGIAGSDDVSGSLTSNLGTLSVDADGALLCGFSVRYPVTWSGEDLRERITKAANAAGASLHGWSDAVPLYVPKDDPLVATLLEVYRAETGDMQPPKSMGGGTYARVLKKGVAFGPNFPGFPDNAHQADEYWTITDMMKASIIYAKALARLGMQE